MISSNLNSTGSVIPENDNAFVNGFGYTLTPIKDDSSIPTPEIVTGKDVSDEQMVTPFPLVTVNTTSYVPFWLYVCVGDETVELPL